MGETGTQYKLLAAFSVACFLVPASISGEQWKANRQPHYLQKSQQSALLSSREITHTTVNEPRKLKSAAMKTPDLMTQKLSESAPRKANRTALAKKNPEAVVASIPEAPVLSMQQVSQPLSGAKAVASSPNIGPDIIPPSRLEKTAPRVDFPAFSVEHTPFAGQSGQVLSPTSTLSPGIQDGVNDEAIFGPDALEVTITDVDGRKMYHSRRGHDGTLRWDGRGPAGKIVDQGLYFAAILDRTGREFRQSFSVIRAN